MVAYLRSQRLTLPLAPTIAVAVGLVLALGFVAVPAELLEQWSVASGIAAVLPAAAPPLGATARMVLISGVAGGLAIAAWLGLTLLLGERSFTLALPSRAPRKADVPVVRRADAHPDAPARRPLSATHELGTPPPAKSMPPVERALPTDLDTPLAAFDPAAIPEQPVAWQASAPADLQPGERLETFPLTAAAANSAGAPLPLRSARWLVEEPEPAPLAVAPTPPSPPAELSPSVPPAVARPARARPDPSATVHALLDRLERSVAEYDRPRRPLALKSDERLHDTIASLQRLALRA